MKIIYYILLIYLLLYYKFLQSISVPEAAGRMDDNVCQEGMVDLYLYRWTKSDIYVA